MSRVINLAGKLRAVAPYIRTEDEAIEAAEALADEIRTVSSAHDRQRSHQERERIARSGIFGITVPTEYGGADISNPFLAEVLAILSEADSSVGRILQSHFYILEVLRIAATENQKRHFFTRALAGDHFTAAPVEKNGEAEGNINLPIAADSAGYRFTRQKYYPNGALFGDWTALFIQDAKDRNVMAIVPRYTDGMMTVDDWAGFSPGSVTKDNRYVSADSVIAYYKVFEQPTALEPLGQLLHAAIDLGIARASFTDMIDSVKTRSRGSRSLDIESEKTGSVAVKIEASAAVIERAGRKVDIAQVSPSALAASEASLAVATAEILSTEAAAGAANALFALAGTSATSKVFVPGHHERMARTGAVDDQAPRKYAAIGEFHLNDKLPRPNDRF